MKEGVPLKQDITNEASKGHHHRDRKIRTHFAYTAIVMIANYDENFEDFLGLFAKGGLIEYILGKKNVLLCSFN